MAENTDGVVEAILSFAQQFPTLYKLRKTSDGVEIVSHDNGSPVCVFFRNDGTAYRTDVKSARMVAWEGARVLGMVG